MKKAKQFRPTYTALPAERKQFADIKEFLGLLEQLEGTRAPKTLKAYKADARVYWKFCKMHGFTPLSNEDAHLVAFFQEQAKAFTFSTVDRRYTSLRFFFRLLGIREAFETVNMQLEWDRIKRAIRGPQAQAFPLRKPDVQVIEKSLIKPESLMGVFLRLLLNLCYDTAGRCSEVAGATFENIHRVDKRHGYLWIPKSKNDPHGYGQKAVVSDKTLKLLRQWSAMTGLNTGPVLRHVRLGKILNRRFTADDVGKTLRTMVQEAGYPDNVVQSISGHSTRIGAVQDMEADGKTISQIQRRGRWKSLHMATRYLRNGDLACLL